MRIAIPITATSMDEVLKDMDKIGVIAEVDSEFEHIIELRIDYMSKPNLEKLISHSQLPKIVTNRIKQEGGRFEGTEDERIAYLQEAIDLGAEYVDIESDYFHPFERGSTKLIVSHHNFQQTPENLEEIYRNIVIQNPDIVKIATKAQNLGDSLRMINLIANSDKYMIGICMGQQGVITRVLGPVYGGYLTFASLEKGKASAPGQLSVEELKNTYKLLQLEEQK
jgi:3-dehydroquinate dehydratase/shikimate dehydrogenase